MPIPEKNCSCVWRGRNEYEEDYYPPNCEDCDGTGYRRALPAPPAVPTISSTIPSARHPALPGIESGSKLQLLLDAVACYAQHPSPELLTQLGTAALAYADAEPITPGRLSVEDRLARLERAVFYPDSLK